MMCIIALCLAYGLVKLGVPDYTDAPAIRKYGTDDPAEWAAALRERDFRVIDGGGDHE
jgi:hypothetical protein